MTAFQEKCISTLNAAREAMGKSAVEFCPVEGRAQKYLLAKVKHRDESFDIYIYEDEAGFMKNGTDWTIFERPDFSCDKKLIESFVDSVMSALSL